MAQATPSISRHTALTIAQHIAMATMTRSMQLARGMVKEELKKQRIRLADVEAREISERALDYLIAHPELEAEARLAVSEWFARGVFGKRAKRAVGCAAITNFLPLIRHRQSIALAGKDFDWLGYVLKILQPESAIAECEFVLHLIVSLARDANTAMRRDAFKTGRNINAIAVQVVAFDDDVAKMHADAKDHAALSLRPSITGGHRTLNFSRTADAFYDT